ncbi:MAG TPA: 50S ribosomal protein L2 [Candidatus Azoamicus sp. OHIO1]
MILKKYKPTTPGIRGLISIKNTSLYKGSPLKSLTFSKKCSSGRNNLGRITVWGRGGGHKRKYRYIDWKRDKCKVLAKVERIEYDPNRTPYIALLLYEDGERRYIVCPNKVNVGDFVVSGDDSPIKDGNNLPLKSIPLGTFIHCVELVPGCGAQLARSAGASVQLLAKDEKHATVRLRSGEVRKVLLDCCATVGEICKSEHNLQKLGKAGRNRWKNNKPRVRGVAMNPVDHPLGGGEGKTSGGRPACSPWGLLDGKVTRSRNKRGGKLIIKSRRKK